jgi:hypothetical protein
MPHRAFEEVVLPHLDAALNDARWLTKSDADAEDVVQDAPVRALRFFSSLRNDGAESQFDQSSFDVRRLQLFNVNAALVRNDTSDTLAQDLGPDRHGRRHPSDSLGPAHHPPARGAPALAGAVPSVIRIPGGTRNQSHQHGILLQFLPLGIAEGRRTRRWRLSAHQIAQRMPEPFTRAK